MKQATHYSNTPQVQPKSFPEGYILYARRSTDDAENQKNSIDYQAQLCRDFAIRAGLPVASLTLDGFSIDGLVSERHSAFKTKGLRISAAGTIEYTIERPKFQRLVGMLVEKKIRGIICLCWDRLSRNENDALIIKALIEQGHDIRFVHTTYERSSSGSLHMSVDSMFSEHASRATSERVKATGDKLLREGKWPRGAPLGYLNLGSASKPLDPVRGPIIREMFRLYAAGGWSLAQITKWARQHGLRTRPIRERRSASERLTEELGDRARTERPVSVKGIEKILTNTFYAGKLKSGEHFVDSIYEPLISWDLYCQVQRVMRGRCVSVHYVDRQFSIYAGMVRCQCGHLYSQYEQKGRRYYRVQCKDTCDNTARNTTERRLNAMVVELLRFLEFTDDELVHLERMATRHVKEAQVKEAKERESRYRRVERMHADLKYLRDEKILLLRLGTYTPSSYMAAVADLETAIHGAESVNTESPEPAEFILSARTITELAKTAEQSFISASDFEKREVCTRLITELTVVNGKLANFSGKGALELVLKRRFDAKNGKCVQEFRGTELMGFANTIVEASDELLSISSVRAQSDEATIQLAALDEVDEPPLSSNDKGLRFCTDSGSRLALP